MVSPLLKVEGFRKHFPVKAGGRTRTVKAVDDVSLSVGRGQVLGVVGESGCGKSTLARLLLGLIVPDAGTLAIEGTPFALVRRQDLLRLRRTVQMVFQDSFASLNPRLTILETVAFGPRAHGARRREALERAGRYLDLVGLAPEQFGRRYPHELSGGQRQRANIARALAIEPRLVILDEAVSALDKSVQAQVLNLLADLRRQLSLTMVFISHDLGVVEYFCDEVMVMYLGKVVERADAATLFERPLHPYTRALLSATPSIDPDRRTESLPIIGEPASPIDPPPGCRFHTRCPWAEPVCGRQEPPLRAPEAAGRQVACHAWDAGSGHSRAPFGDRV